MNIVTFATPVSVARTSTAPHKLWIVSLYRTTKTRQTFFDSGLGVLQLLTPDQKHLVPVLGKRSGYDEGYSKRKACRDLGYDWVRGGIYHPVVSGNDNNSDTCGGDTCGDYLDLLPGCALYIQLQYVSKMDAGDHEVALCQVTSTGVWNGEKVVVAASDDGLSGTTTRLDPSNVLYTGLLRAEGII